MEYNSQQRYNELFPNDAIKAKAFDEIAKQYYFCNFGTMQKSDSDVLLFSLYIDQILKQTEKMWIHIVTILCQNIWHYAKQN